jgi:AMP-polyphosphate phosphotransferase
MMQKTSTRRAPWHLIPANDKPYGRLAALRIMADRLAKNVSLEPRPLDPKVLEAALRPGTASRRKDHLGPDNV